MIAKLKSDARLSMAWTKSRNGQPILAMHFDHGPDADFPELATLLEDQDMAVRRASADSIGLYKTLLPFTRVAVQPLVKALKDSDPSVRVSAGDALKAIDPEAAARAGVR